MRRALIVDDAEAVRHLIAAHLRALRPTLAIDEAETATAGLDAFLEHEYDLTVLDGFFADGTRAGDVLDAMLAARPTARVVVCTSRPREHPDVADALGNGAYAYLAKPVRRPAVDEILQRVEIDEGRLKRIP